MRLSSTSILVTTSLMSLVSAQNPETCCTLTSFQQCGRDYNPPVGGSRECASGLCIYGSNCDLNDPDSSCIGSCTECAARTDQPPPPGSPDGSCCSIKTDRQCGRDYHPAGLDFRCRQDEQCYYDSGCDLNDPKSKCVGTCWKCPPLV